MILHPPTVTGTGNIIPKTIVKLYATSVAALKTGDPKLMQEALKLQDIVSAADWCIIKVSPFLSSPCAVLIRQSGKWEWTRRALSGFQVLTS